MALRKEPARRYASVEQFSEDIRLYLEGRPVRARKDTVRYRASKFLRRNRVGVALGVLALIGIVTGVLAVNRQARRAEYRFQEVRKLANTVLFDLNGEIENLAGSTKARELLVRTSLQYLDSLAAEGGSDPSLQLEMASAYEKIGDVQGNPLFSHLGHPKASLESYANALAIAQKLAPSQPVLELMARARYKTGCVYNWGLGRFSDAKESIRQGIRVADSIPRLTGQPAYRVRVEAYGFLGDMQTYRDAGAALAPLRHSLEVARQWAAAEPRSETTYFLAVAMSRMGAASQETGDLSAALDFYTNALRLIDQLLKQQPENATWQRERYAMYDRLDWVTGHPQYLNLGDRKGAAVWAQKLVSPDAERLAAADPENIRARFELGEATAALGAVLRESDPARSEQLYRRSLALSAYVLSVNPDDAETGYWRSFNQVGFAWVLQKLGNRTEALKELQSAVERLQRLARQNPDDVRVPEYLGLALHTLAAHRLEMGDPAGAGAGPRAVARLARAALPGESAQVDPPAGSGRLLPGIRRSACQPLGVAGGPCLVSKESGTVAALGSRWVPPASMTVSAVRRRPFWSPRRPETSKLLPAFNNPFPPAQPFCPQLRPTSRVVIPHVWARNMGKDRIELLQGTLDVMVLQTLAGMGPLHGYGIARRIEQASGAEVLLNQGTIYASLVRLQQRGWISAEWGVSDNNRKAKFYALTRQGRKQLARETDYWRKLTGVMGRVLAFSSEGDK